jgi:hypothetical protein
MWPALVAGLLKAGDVLTHHFIDADPIVYRAGFAGETNHYVIVAEDADGNMHEGSFSPTTESKGKARATAWANAKTWLEANKLTLVSKEINVIAEPIENQLTIVKTQIQHIVDAVNKRLGHDAQVTLFLSGPDNFREALATFKPYKGNRDAGHKPFHYQAIRDYLTGTWNSVVVHGREADDELSIRSWEKYRDGKPFVLSTIDKDLDQVPGEHYNYMKHVHYSVDELYGELFFYQQALSGDLTDNIGGACVSNRKKTGYVRDRAAEIVKRWYQDATKRSANWQDHLWKQITATYVHQAKELGDACYYTEAQAQAAALESARLVYMQQEVGQLWTPPGEPSQWLEGTVLDD